MLSTFSKNLVIEIKLRTVLLHSIVLLLNKFTIADTGTSKAQL
jgi:hypothetical protein